MSKAEKQLATESPPRCNLLEDRPKPGTLMIFMAQSIYERLWRSASSLGGS